MHELDTIYADAAKSGCTVTPHVLRRDLTMWSRALLDSLPDFIQVQLMLERTSTNLVKLSQTETERLLAHFVSQELSYRKKKGTYQGNFSVICSFIGYQARGATPTNFDVNYGYNLGYVTSVLIGNKLTGYMATIHNLKSQVEFWHASGVPLTAMMRCSHHYDSKLIVPKAHINLQSVSYRRFNEQKLAWGIQDQYKNPGPVQYDGPTANSISQSLQLESFDYLTDIQRLYDAINQITECCRPGCSSTVLRIATKNLNALSEIVHTIQETESVDK